MPEAREPRGIDAVLFDFDGTLVDSSRAICRAFDEALASEGRPPLADEAIRPMIGRPLVEMFAAADPGAPPERLERYVAAYRAAWDRLAIPLTRPMPAMVETVSRLAETRRLGIVTSRVGSGALRLVEALGLGDLFGVVVGLDRVSRPKPDPEGLLLALARLGASPARALMVGDTPDDVRAGRAAGALAVGVTTGVYGRAELEAAGADEVVSGLAELLPLVGLLTAGR